MIVIDNELFEIFIFATVILNAAIVIYAANTVLETLKMFAEEIGKLGATLEEIEKRIDK